MAYFVMDSIWTGRHKMIWMSPVMMALLICWFRVVMIDVRDVTFHGYGYTEKWLKPDLEVSYFSFLVNEWKAYATVQE